mgnify:FL=1|tara:strand:+ start:32 stop:739 length:708 start_codon:yes stop_codon:yes gene_type:complete
MGKGKWLGGALGWAFGGIFGAFIGYQLGSVFDGKKGSQRGTSFELALLGLSAIVIKADGKIKKEELNYVKNFFRQNFGEAKSKIYFKVFNDLKDKETPSLKSLCTQVNQNVNHNGRLQIIHFLFAVASSDNEIADIELKTIKTIANYFHINNYDFQSIHSMFLGKSNNIENDYKILEVSKDATDDEIKKAYRKMAKKYHPDKLQGVSDDVVKMAQEKFNKVTQAYNRIMDSRKDA